MTVSSNSSETGTIRAPSPPNRPDTRSPTRSNRTPPPTSPPTIPLPPTPTATSEPTSLSPATAPSKAKPPPKPRSPPSAFTATMRALTFSSSKVTSTSPKSQSVRTSKSTRLPIPAILLPKPKSSKPVPEPLPANAVILHHRGHPIVHVRPPTPVPLRPSTPPGLRRHVQLPPNTIVSPLVSSPSHSKDTLSQESDVSIVKPLSLSNKRLERGHTRTKSDDVAIKLKKKSLPPIPSPPSTITPRRVFAPHNRHPSTPLPLSKLNLHDRFTTISIPSFLELDPEVEYQRTPIPIPSELPPTPSSAVFPSGIVTPLGSDADLRRLCHSREGSMKSIDSWSGQPAFAEQQGLVAIHRLLSSLWEEGCEDEIKGACQTLSKFLPRPGVQSERKYTLKVSQEQELEQALRTLDGAVYRDIDAMEIEKAKQSLINLAPMIQQRFATLPHHRELQRLREERSQVKEDRALLLLQLSLQEAEIKAAQSRRQAERDKEIEEAALRRVKRREEKLRERKAYDTLRASLDSRSRELKVIARDFEKEVKRLAEARQSREIKFAENGQKVRRIAIPTVRSKEGKENRL